MMTTQEQILNGNYQLLEAIVRQSNDNALELSRRLQPCKWTADESTGAWLTACKEAHCFTDGGPKENRHLFCPYCGRPIN